MNRPLLTLLRATALALPLLAVGPALASTTVTIESMGFTNNGNVIQTALPGFGSTAEVTLDWNPVPDAGRTLVNWLGSYSGRDAAYCGGTDCTLDLLANAGSVVTLDSFWLGGWPNTNRQIAWSVIDLATGGVVASDAPTGPNVSGATGLTVLVGASSATGLRILFGPDGFNGGINDITFSATPVPEPEAWALWLAGLGAVALVARRRRG
jgi:MYXO-CTERM domain-containing protein